jgi:hypothetical protein
MFIFAVLIIFIVSFLLAIKSMRTINEKPETRDVKKSLDKDRVIFQGHASSK